MRRPRNDRNMKHPRGEPLCAGHQTPQSVRNQDTFPIASDYARSRIDEDELGIRWAATRQTAAISVVFNLVNSAAALAGTWATLPLATAQLPFWLVSGGVGGLLGSWMGALHLDPRTLRLLLAFLLLAAAANDRCLFLGATAVCYHVLQRARDRRPCRRAPSRQGRVVAIGK
jgi:hypothetical protein